MQAKVVKYHDRARYVDCATDGHVYCSKCGWTKPSQERLEWEKLSNEQKWEKYSDLCALYDADRIE